MGSEMCIRDRPTTALDGNSRALILQQLNRLQSEHQTAILLISHDLSVIRQNCSNIMVMYCGRLLEKAASGNLFSNPRHPYTAGLLACIPTISDTRPAQIGAIPGQVPSSSDLPDGCHFAPRCARAVTSCTESIPVFDKGTGEGVACFRPLP